MFTSAQSHCSFGIYRILFDIIDTGRFGPFWFENTVCFLNSMNFIATHKNGAHGRENINDGWKKNILEYQIFIRK